MSDRRELRAILVGAGGFGQVWSDLNTRGMGVQIAAAVDTEPSALTAFSAVSGLSSTHCYEHLYEALEKEAADILIDSTPPQFHRANAMLAFQHQLHVFTAKPIAVEWEDAIAMSRAAEERSLLLGVNEQLRFGWLPLALAGILEAGELGTLESICLTFREPSSWHGWRAEMGHPLLLDAAIQHFDMVRATTDLEIESAYCRAWRRDESSFGGAGSAAAIIQLTGGIPFIYEGTWEQSREGGDATGWWGEWRIQGSRGELRAEGKKGIWINGASSPVAVETLDVRRLCLVVLDQFLRGVREGATMPTNAWSDLRSLAMSELCIRSTERGAVARMEELEPSLAAAEGDPAGPVPAEPVVEPPLAPAPDAYGG